MRRGVIWLINLDPTVDAEMKKTRPAVIVSIELTGGVYGHCRYTIIHKF